VIETSGSENEIGRDAVQEPNIARRRVGGADLLIRERETGIADVVGEGRGGDEMR